MVIDMEMYEKYSGRKGDPMDRLGAAHAQSDAASSSREERMHKIKMAQRVSGPRFGWPGLLIRVVMERPWVGLVIGGAVLIALLIVGVLSAVG